MIAFSFYLLKVMVCSAVLFGYYWLLLRNKIFHSYNRFYLLAVVVLSLTLPLVKFTIWQQHDGLATSVVQMLQVVNSGDELMDEVVIRSHTNHFDKEQIAGLAFLLICMFFIVMFIKTLLKIYRLKRTNQIEAYDDIVLIKTNDTSTPFSFFKNIFWNNAIDINSNSGSRILKHELAHVSERHTYDKLFINVVLLFFWCNPIFWLLRKELNMIHEFTADRKSVEDGDTSAFAAMILQTTYPSQRFELTNNFFYSPIKRRLAMLTKNNKNMTYFSRILVLPVAAILFAAFTLKTKMYAVTSHANKTITVVLDAGHGGTDNGATGIDGTLEKDITLSLVKRIKELNTDDNINIVLTREIDVYQTPKEKATLAKTLGANLFISVHVDNQQGLDQSTHSGVSLWVAKNEFDNTEKSKLFASAMIGSFKENFTLNVVDNPKQSKTGIWVLQASECPAILIESGFMNNKKDRAFLKSSSGQDQFAKKVLEGIYSFVADKSFAQMLPENLKTGADTSLEKTDVTDVTAENIKISINGSENDKKQILYIINGEIAESKDLKYKAITAKKAKIYGAQIG